jgi:flagellar biosynthesis protein FliR
MISIPDPTSLLFGAAAFIRIAGILLMVPIFGDSPTPIQARILIALCFTLCIYPLVNVNYTATSFPRELFALSILVVKEMVIGLIIGFVSRLTSRIRRNHIFVECVLLPNGFWIRKAFFA